MRLFIPISMSESNQILFSGTEGNGFKILLNKLEIIMVLCTGYDQ